MVNEKAEARWLEEEEPNAAVAVVEEEPNAAAAADLGVLHQTQTVWQTD